jgi:hypothetical protein
VVRHRRQGALEDVLHPFDGGLVPRQPLNRAFCLDEAHRRGCHSAKGKACPANAAGRVAIERSSRGKWRRLRTLKAGSNGVFRKRIRGPRKGSIRARVVKTREASVGFSLKRPPDMPVNPFGSTG